MKSKRHEIWQEERKTLKAASKIHPSNDQIRIPEKPNKQTKHQGTTFPGPSLAHQPRGEEVLRQIQVATSHLHRTSSRGTHRSGAAETELRFPGRQSRRIRGNRGRNGGFGGRGKGETDGAWDDSGRGIRVRVCRRADWDRERKRVRAGDQMSAREWMIVERERDAKSERELRKRWRSKGKPYYNFGIPGDSFSLFFLINKNKMSQSNRLEPWLDNRTGVEPEFSGIIVFPSRVL